MDLTKILKVGDTVYSALHGGNVQFIFRLSPLNNKLIVGADLHDHVEFNLDGSFIKDGECLLFPSKEVRTWENYCPFKKGETCLFWDNDKQYKDIGVFFKKGNGKYYNSWINSDGELNYYSSFDNCELFDPSKYNL